MPDTSPSDLPPLTLQVNGDVKELVASRTLADLLAELDLAPATVLLEINGEAPPRSAWPNTPLTTGDRVEILRVAAGG
jgi:sulfur carrier protein